MSEQVPAVRLSGVVKRFGDATAVAGVDLEISQGEFFTMLGPSGSGKTTLLRMIAGFELPDEGLIELGGVDATFLPANARDVNTVFQDYALFPHMDVISNVAYGLRVAKVGKAERTARARSALEMVQLTGFESRRPAQLSGGQRQRVALARAIVNEPGVLLLDEPLGALDLKLRQEMQIELKAIQRRVGITFVYVTHDQEEALTMSDRVAVLDHGCDPAGRYARFASTSTRPANSSPASSVYPTCSSATVVESPYGRRRSTSWSPTRRLPEAPISSPGRSVR